MAAIYVNTTDTTEQKIRDLMKVGVLDQNELYRLLYPTYNGHYGTLRDLIARVKNG